MGILSWGNLINTNSSIETSVACVVTADKEEAVTTHELTNATSTPAHEKERHRDYFDSTHRSYVSRSVCLIQNCPRLVEMIKLPEDLTPLNSER